ncbi:MAG: 6-phosphogluconolactonase [Rhizobiaceae bacterium]
MQFHEFDSRDDLAQALAEKIGQILSSAVEANGKAVLAVSGGSTPERLFKVLSGSDLPWENITVTLVDERFVEPANPRSNMGFVARLLLQDKAAHAKFLPLHDGSAETTGQAIKAAEDEIAALGKIDVCVLGMGTDGHTASFFPGGSRLLEAIDPETRHLVLEMTAPDAGEARLTLTLPFIMSSGSVFLHIEGDAKLEVLEKAQRKGPAEELPVRSVLNSVGKNLEVYWAA